MKLQNPLLLKALEEGELVSVSENAKNVPENHELLLSVYKEVEWRKLRKVGQVETQKQTAKMAYYKNKRNGGNLELTESLLSAEQHGHQEKEELRQSLYASISDDTTDFKKPKGSLLTLVIFDSLAIFYGLIILVIQFITFA